MLGCKYDKLGYIFCTYAKAALKAMVAFEYTATSKIVVTRQVQS